MIRNLACYVSGTSAFNMSMWGASQGENLRAPLCEETFASLGQVKSVTVDSIVLLPWRLTRDMKKQLGPIRHITSH